jgi:putative ubiquitin-RnfH superfamily antitoxin RatB of RatAB toxin-antitoxin module
VSKPQIKIEVAFALPEKQTLLELLVNDDSTVEEAIRASSMMSLYPQIDLAENKVGIWSRACKLTDSLKEGDRIEVYRPLIADPKEVRRRRAEKAVDEGRANKITGGRPKKSP